MSEIKRCGIITICGRPNVGKSTLTNALVGEKVAIVTNKPQTTRNRICGIRNRGESQFVFVDTPGLHKARTRLGDYMVNVVKESVADVAGIMLVVEPIPHIGGPEAELIARIKALLRRYCVYQGKSQPGSTYGDGTISSCGVTVALDHNQVWVQDEEKDLTELEYQILKLLIQRPQWIFSAQSIYENIWNEPYFPASNGTIMVHIRKLRMKIEADPQNPVYIKTVWGKGYRFGWEDHYGAK